MDKLTEAHELCELGIKSSYGTQSHASITREYMGKFAEWASNNYFEFIQHSNLWVNKYCIGPDYTTSELIELYLKESV